MISQVILQAYNDSSYDIGYWIGYRIGYSLPYLLIAYVIYRVLRFFLKGKEKVIVKDKYSTLIGHIMNRNAYYQMKEVEDSKVILTCTGVTFSLIQVSDRLQVNWIWNSFSTGKTYKHQWYFKGNRNQDEMYKEIDKEIRIQSTMDNGFTRIQAEEYLKIMTCSNPIEREKLLETFAKKYPDFMDNIMNSMSFGSRVPKEYR